MTSRDWAHLPRNIVYQIATSLKDLNMEDCFRMVCKPWHSGVNPILEQRAERRKSFFEAELALMTMRYKDSYDIIQSICKVNSDLSPRERGLLFKCYFKVLLSIRKRRAALGKINQENDSLTGERIKVEAELMEVCDFFTDLVDSYLLPAAEDAESVLFYKRMKGQLIFYQAETKAGEERILLAEQCRMIYEEALETASTELSPSNKEVILLQTSRSLLYFKILNDEQTARNLAGQTYVKINNSNWHEWDNFGEGIDLVMFYLNNPVGIFHDEVEKQDQFFYTSEIRTLNERESRRKSL